VTSRHRVFPGALVYAAIPIALLIAGVFGHPAVAQAAPATTLSVYSGLERGSDWALPKALSGIRSFSVARADVDGDGSTETVLAGGPRERALVAVLDAAGRLRRTFDVYGRGFRGGLEVAAGDLDGDGIAEIVTAPAGHGGPDVRVFSSNGTLRFRFNAFAPNFRGGVRLAVGDVTGDGRPEIVTAAGPDGEPQIRVFTSEGKFSGRQWYAFERERKAGVRVAVGDVDADGVGEIVVASGEAPATVTVRRASGAVVSSFAAFNNRTVGGARVAVVDVNGDGVTEIVVTPASNDRVLRALSVNGAEVGRTTPPKSSIGVSLAAAPRDRTFVAVANRPAVEGRTDLHRYIEVDISDQRLRFYEDGVKLGDRPVSTGKWDMPTPLGQFQIRNKIRVAYSKRYKLYMDWWMAFTPDGSYGVHSLPYWKLKNGGRYYEGENHLGRRVSHGCIRQKLDDAKTLYDWASIGTPVIVRE
jgi:lipoprotein-anchoring transpeptidase ErfK/SrfK